MANEHERDKQIGEEGEEEYVLLELDDCLYSNIQPDAPYILSGLDTLTPTLIVGDGVKMGESCGFSCHLECALGDERSGILQSGQSKKLDGGYYCIHCGKQNDLLGLSRPGCLARGSISTFELAATCSLNFPLCSFRPLLATLRTISRVAMADENPQDQGSPDSALSTNNYLRTLAQDAFADHVPSLMTNDGTLNDEIDHRPSKNKKCQPTARRILHFKD